MTARARLERLYVAGVTAADPRPRTREAVSHLDLAGTPTVIAAGKGAVAMAEGAVEALASRGMHPSIGLVVSHEGLPARVGPLPHVAGAHPVPDERSGRAARALAGVVDQARRGTEALVLVSGGATSLIAQPVDGIRLDELVDVFEALLRSGAPINTVNAIRRRLLRWGAGRLAASLAPARVHCLIVSDVMGGELAAIASGPCVADPAHVADVRSAITRWSVRVPSGVEQYLARVERGEEAETPKPGDARLAGASARIILDNATAVAAIRDEASRAGMVLLDLHDGPIAGDAADAGHAIATGLVMAAREDAAAWRCMAAGGEPTVTIQGTSHGLGGRCQELALAAARVLHAAGVDDRVSLLAAGTDGRDGPSDAAGAVVDGTTWGRMALAGRDPAADLARHDAYHALDSAGALLRTGATGTNVNDVVIAVLAPTDHRSPVTDHGSAITRLPDYPIPR